MVRQRKQEEKENQAIIAFSDVVFELITRIGPRSASGAHAGRRSRMKWGLRLVELADMLARNVAEGRLKCKENYSELCKDSEKKVFLRRLGEGCKKAEEMRRVNGRGEQRKAVVLVSRRKTEKRREEKKKRGENRKLREKGKERPYR